MQVAGEHLAEHAGHDEEAAAARNLGLGVPAAEHVLDAGPGGGFEESDAEPEGVELGGVVAFEEEEDEEGPGEEAEGQPDPGPGDGENEIRKGPADDDSGVEVRVHPAEFVARAEVEVLRHAGRVCICDVVPVELLDEEREAAVAEQEPVQLEDQPLVCLAGAGLMPSKEAREARGASRCGLAGCRRLFNIIGHVVGHVCCQRMNNSANFISVEPVELIAQSGNGELEVGLRRKFPVWEVGQATGTSRQSCSNRDHQVETAAQTCLATRPLPVHTTDVPPAPRR